MATEFSKKTKQLIKALEACGRHFSASSKAQISVSQFKKLLRKDTLFCLLHLPTLQHLAGDRPLSLTEARALYDSPILDSVCSILSRLTWREFGNRLDEVANVDGEFIAAGRALDCVIELLHARERVQPSRDAKIAWQESFSR